MNERIEKLAKQAGYKHPDAVGECEDYAYFDHKEFAELIIQECARDEIERLRKDKAELLKMLNQMLDDMGATGHSVCGAVKAMGRYIIAKHQTDEEAFLDYTIHQAVKVLLEVDMISKEQAKTAIAKATRGE